MHVGTRNSAQEGGDVQQGIITEARINADERYCNDANQVLRDELAQEDVNHLGFKFSLKPEDEEAKP